MRKKNGSIPVNTMSGESGAGIAIDRITAKDLAALITGADNSFEPARQAHREDRHSFFLLEKGTVHLEIDFRKFTVKPNSVIYLHPDQVHRIISVHNMTVSSWAIDNENLNPEYLRLLEEINPAEPLMLKKDTFSIIAEALSLCVKLSERKNDRLHQLALKDSCNALVALVVSQYLEHSKSANRLSRFETVSRSFRAMLELDYIKIKRPAEFARKLNISIPYLNECVKNSTGFPVSYHIRQRVILEAKRLLYHSDKTIKEIAASLGYDDYPYFSRLFNKVTGTSALAFRNKKLD